ncbi:MAG TPA: hypothetical protein VKB19_00565, partial [Pedobacter sp.]|nr:hypothetical protein [Pedobacter sp.]
DGNGSTDSVIISRSMITQWSGTIRSLWNPIFIADMNADEEYTGDKRLSRFEVVGYDLKQLYKIAYSENIEYFPVEGRKNNYGKFWNFPILEVKDSSQFFVKTNSSKNFYNYSVMVPRSKNSIAIMQSFLQRDLEANFGYKGFVEERMMPCWNLVANTNAGKKLMAKGSKFSGKPSVRTDIMVLDQPVSKLIAELAQSFQRGYPIIDATGIETNIDIYIEGLRDDFNDMRRGLQKNGLDLVKSEKKMKVVVIRDPKPAPSSK